MKNKDLNENQLANDTFAASAASERNGSTGRHSQPKYADYGTGNYAILVAIMCIIVILSGIGGAKGVVFTIGGFDIITDGAFFMFPIAYIMGDTVTELYGKKAATRAVAMGFITNVIAALIYWVIIILPGFSDDYGIEKQHGIEVALGPVWQIVLASMTGFAIGQTANSAIMWFGKKRHLERRLVRRLMSATGVGELLDTIVFCTIAASAIGILTVGQWANYTIFGFLWKILVQYAMMPVTVTLIKWLKKREPTYANAE